MPAPLKLNSTQALTARLEALTIYLERWRPLWRERAFVARPTSWEEAYPEVRAYIDRLPLEAFTAAARPWLEGAPSTLRLWAEEGARLAWLPTLEPRHPKLRAGLTRRVSGRKVEQVARFAGQVQARWASPERITDWCAGKGHLGRIACHLTGARLQAIEWSQPLCDAGAARCADEGVAAEFRCLDATTPEASAALSPDDVVVALHACGGLHTTLLRAAAARRLAGLALAPCCYNQPAPDRGAALSRAGLARDLGLTKSDLDLLHREPVNAKGWRRRRSRQEQIWRLAFDGVQRRVTGRDAYRAMPTIPSPWLSLPFEAFCRRFAALDGLEIPEGLDVAPALAWGEAEHEIVQRRDAVRGLFSAPLEAWLVLDRALSLAEAGYEVEVGRFCERQLTPRNAMILAS